MGFFNRFLKPPPVATRRPSAFEALNSLKNRHTVLKTQFNLAEKAEMNARNKWNIATRNNTANVNNARAAYNAAMAARANAGQKLTSATLQLSAAKKNANKLMGHRR
jgi:hypothetical protein